MKKVFLTSLMGATLAVSTSYAIPPLMMAMDTSILDVFLWCAPEVKEGNLAAVDHSLMEAIETNSFKGEQLFREKISAIIAEKDQKKKIVSYLELVGITKSNENKEELAEFLGGTVSEAQLKSAQEALKISKEQAVELATRISSSLRGTLQ